MANTTSSEVKIKYSQKYETRLLLYIKYDTIKTAKHDSLNPNIIQSKVQNKNPSCVQHLRSTNKLWDPTVYFIENCTNIRQYTSCAVSYILPKNGPMPRPKHVPVMQRLLQSGYFLVTPLITNITGSTQLKCYFLTKCYFITKTQQVSITNINQLLFTEIIAAYSENHSKQMNARG